MKNDNIPDSAIQLYGLTCWRADRDSSLSGKTRGGGLCVFINKEWFNNAAVLSKHCSSLVEFMVVKCRPFYLPLEFTVIVIFAVYIPSCANAKDALCELYSAIREQQTFNPDGFFIIAGDFNHANLKRVFPKFYQHVNFATRGNNTLYFVYTAVKSAYKAEPRPHLGCSDHISVMLIPAYRPLLKLAKPVQKQIKVWPDNATSALQDCFQDTDWSMFKEAATYNNHTDLRSILKLWLLTSKSALMMWQSPRPSPHVQTRRHGQWRSNRGHTFPALLETGDSVQRSSLTQSLWETLYGSALTHRQYFYRVLWFVYLIWVN